jgi:hypothetical protein
MADFVGRCPSCHHQLVVRELSCPQCGVAVSGQFGLPPAMTLTPDQARFLRLFVLARGNLKEMERILGVSYPTVRARLDQLVAVFQDEALGSASDAPAWGDSPAGAIADDLRHTMHDAMRRAGGAGRSRADGGGTRPPDPDRMAVLDRIARGDLTVDQGIEELTRRARPDR